MKNKIIIFGILCSLIVAAGAWEVTKIYRTTIIGTENITTEYIQVSHGNVTLITPSQTRCIWYKAADPRICFQDFEIHNNRKDFRLQWKHLKKIGRFMHSERVDTLEVYLHYNERRVKVLNLRTYLITNNITIRKDRIYNFTLEFPYPANAGEEWNLTFIYDNENETVELVAS